MVHPRLTNSRTASGGPSSGVAHVRPRLAIRDATTLKASTSAAAVGDVVRDKQLLEHTATLAARNGNSALCFGDAMEMQCTSHVAQSEALGDCNISQAG
jgi:hypothetical protein